MSASPVVAVLAGGAGRRMGAPKASVPLAGRPLVAWPLAAAAAAGLDAVVVAKEATPLPPGVSRWIEPAQPRHPLLGLVCALERAGGRDVIALACDMPFVNACALRLLAELPAPAVALVQGRLEPLLARYGPAQRAPLEAALERELPLRAAVAALAPRVVGEAELAACGDPVRLVAGVNDRAALAAAERALAG